MPIIVNIAVLIWNFLSRQGKFSRVDELVQKIKLLAPRLLDRRDMISCDSDIGMGLVAIIQALPCVKFGKLS